MIRSIHALVVALMVVGPTPAAAQVSFFDFDWSTSAEFSTFNPDTFQTSRISGAISGQGVLALTRPPELNGAFFFEFSGAGGSGFGQTLPGGRTISPGQFAVPLPPDVPVHTGPVSGFSGGVLDLVGSPSNASAISIEYFEGTSPHCVFDCYAIDFLGAGTRRAVSALEPSATLIEALGLAAAVAVRARRRRVAALARWRT